MKKNAEKNKKSKKEPEREDQRKEKRRSSGFRDMQAMMQANFQLFAFILLPCTAGEYLSATLLFVSYLS